MIKCGVEGCSDTFGMRKGYCNKHYIRLMRHGSPTSGRTYKGEALSFFERAATYKGDDCLIWPYYRDNRGYARIRTGSESKHVHRLICIRVYGEPGSIRTDATHICGNGQMGCVNPKHLEWGTKSKNMMDKVRHGTSNRGERCAAHKLTEDEALAIFNRLQAGERPYLLAKEYGVHNVTVLDIGTGRSWSWLTGLPNPKERDLDGNLVR